MDIGKITPFYRTLSPIEAAALLPKGRSRPIKSSRAREPHPHPIIVRICPQGYAQQHECLFTMRNISVNFRGSGALLAQSNKLVQTKMRPKGGTKIFQILFKFFQFCLNCFKISLKFFLFLFL